MGPWSPKTVRRAKEAAPPGGAIVQNEDAAGPPRVATVRPPLNGYTSAADSGAHSALAAETQRKRDFDLA